jgi:hypothetical protein
MNDVQIVEMFLHGSSSLSLESNRELFALVQSYINETKRFHLHDSWLPSVLFLFIIHLACYYEILFAIVRSEPPRWAYALLGQTSFVRTN